MIVYLNVGIYLHYFLACIIEMLDTLQKNELTKIIQEKIQVIIVTSMHFKLQYSELHFPHSNLLASIDTLCLPYQSTLSLGSHKQVLG